MSECLFLYVCVCIYIYIYMHIYIYVCIHAHTNQNIVRILTAFELSCRLDDWKHWQEAPWVCCSRGSCCVCVLHHARVWMYIYLHTYAYIYIMNTASFSCMDRYIHTYIRIYTNIVPAWCQEIARCVGACMYNKPVYIGVRTHTHTHTHTHINAVSVLWLGLVNSTQCPCMGSVCVCWFATVWTRFHEQHTNDAHECVHIQGFLQFYEPGGIENIQRNGGKKVVGKVAAHIRVCICMCKYV